MSATNTTSQFDTFVVKPLSDFKGVEVEEGMRLSRQIQKGKDSGRESTGVIVPQITMDQIQEFLIANDSLQQYVIDCFENLQDKAIKAKIESGHKTIHHAAFGMYALRDVYEAESVKEGRISKEKIADWFQKNLADSLTVAFADKLGVSDTPTAEEEKKLEQVLNQYRDCYAKLAQREPSFEPAVITKLEKALELAEDSPMKEKLVEKLAAATPKTADLLGL